MGLGSYAPIMEDERDLRRCALHPLLMKSYAMGVAKARVLAKAKRWEAGEFYSLSLRTILAQCHGVHVGAYTYGACMQPGAFPAGVTLGRYTSVAPGVQVYLRDHPMDRLSMHPFFYNQDCGFVDSDTIGTGTLRIGHDAWLGANALILAGCRRIGNGAVIAAGSVVTHDVPDFAIVAGVPARLVRFRFSEQVREKIQASAWWLCPAEEVAQYLSEMVVPLTDESAATHPLLTSTSKAAATVD